MPQAAITLVANFLITAGVSAGIATFVATVFVYAATAAALNAVSRALTPKRKGSGLGSGAEINYFDTGAPIRFVYGRVRIGGMETIPPLTSGINNRELNKLLTIAGHEVDSFNDVQFDATVINQVHIAPNNNSFVNSDGLVISGTYSGHAYIRQYRGNSLAPRYDLRFSLLNLDAQANDIATVALTLIFNQSVYPSVPTVTARVQGKRVYDPRLDTSPGANPDNPSYIAWSPCPALCLADYLRHPLGGGYDADEIDWTTVVTAANYCDDVVAIPSSTGPRYTLNGVIFATDKFIDNVKTMVDAMLGRIIFRDGKWRIYAGSWQTPTFTIPKNAWVGPLTLRVEQGREKRFNKMHCFYVDSARDYQRVECLPQSDSGYLAADGESLEAETEQLLCTNEYEAQRKARFLLRQSRNQISVAGTLPPAYQDIAIWDTGTIVFDFLGWSSKTFRATSLSLRPDGAIDAVFTEEQSGDWTDLAGGDYNTQSVTAFPTANATTPSEPTSFSAAEQINGTILFTLGTPIVRPPGSRFQIIRSTNSADASVGTVVYEGAESPISLVMPTSRHWYYGRTVCNSLVSAYQPNTFGVAVLPRPLADATFNAYIVSDPELEFLLPVGEYWNNSNTNVVSFNPVGGQVAGAIHMTGSAALNQPTTTIFNVPKQPYRRTRAGAYKSVARFRVHSQDVFQDSPFLSIFGWTGSGNPNINNTSAPVPLTFIPTQFTTVVGSDVYPQLGEWMDARGVASLSTLGDGAGWTINPASYPYLCFGLTVPGSNTNILSYKADLDRVEIFFTA